QLEFDRLQRAEALAAGFAFATPPDRRAVVGRTRIDDLGVLVLAEGAVHRASGSSAVDGELPALRGDALAHAGQDGFVLRRVEHVADPVGQRRAVVLAIAAGGDRR